MLLSLIIVSNLAALSVITNILLYRKFRAHKKERPQSLELKEFLGDLMTGNALLRIQRIDPASVYLRSPREMK